MTYVKLHILSLLFFIGNGKVLNNSSKSLYLPEECGQTRYDKSRLETRIIQGELAEIGQFPWMARLGKWRKDKSLLFFCGGSLLNRYFVLSAAHCEDNGKIVRLGENDATTEKDCDNDGDCAPPYQDIEIKKYNFYSFCTITLVNDIVLIELKTAATINDFVQPICLPRTQLSLAELKKENIWLSGWGRITPHYKKYSEQLLYITAPVVEPDVCNRLFTPDIKSSQFCIGYQSGKDTCEGDSGGPASVYFSVNGEPRAHLIGIVSFGLDYCGEGPAVYTNVGYFLHWINRIIDKS